MPALIEEEQLRDSGVLASATGSFSERPVPPPLRASFSCAWVHQMQEAEVPPIIVIPDGTIDLQWIDGTFRVAGPDKDPKTEVLQAGAIVIGFRFQPAAAAPWLQVPVAELLGKRLMLDDLWGARIARSLADAVRSRRSAADLVDSIERVLMQITPAHATDEAMGAVYRLVKNGPPAGLPLVPWLGRTLAMSERTLRRRFDECFGYGPKTLDRILRYQRFLRLARTSPGSTAGLAAEAGYADQAHLARESRRLTGHTPTHLERLMSAGDASPSR